MADKTLEIKITADDKELEKTLSSDEKSVKDFAKQLTKALADVNKFKSKSVTIDVSVKGADDAISKLSKIAELSEKVKDIKIGDLNLDKAVAGTSSKGKSEKATAKEKERSLKAEANKYAKMADKAWQEGNVDDFN